LPASSSNTDEAPVPRDIGNAEFSGRDIAGEVLRNGWAKVKEMKREPTDEDTRKRDLEAEAKAAGKGIWNPHGPQVRQEVLYCRCLVTKIIAGARGTLHDADGQRCLYQ
jgi:hypothetical protein